MRMSYVVQTRPRGRRPRTLRSPASVRRRSSCCGLRSSALAGAAMALHAQSMRLTSASVAPRGRAPAASAPAARLPCSSAAQRRGARLAARAEGGAAGSAQVAPASKPKPKPKDTKARACGRSSGGMPRRAWSPRHCLSMLRAEAVAALCGLRVWQRMSPRRPRRRTPPRCRAPPRCRPRWPS